MIQIGRAVFLGVFAAVAFAGCTTDHSVTWEDGMPWFDANAQGDMYTRFVYHPNAKVYYQPHTQRFFWFEDGHWRSGPGLPPELNTMAEQRLAEVVALQHDLPFMQHETVVLSHPCRQAVPARWDPDQWDPVASAVEF